MALARVSPAIFAAYREGLMDLEALQAFTVTDDHTLQESVWDSLNGWQRGDAGTIRRALTQGDARIDDRRVRFVGLETYEAAGGTVRRDLFAAEDGGYCQDIVLLDRLVREKLDAMAERLKAEGWKWTEGRPSFGWDERRLFEHVQPIPMTDALTAETDSLQTEADALIDSDDDDDQARLAAVEARLAEIDAMPPMWSDEAKSCAGAVVYLCANGEAECERGLVRPEDAAPLVDDEDAPVVAQGDVAEPVAAPLSAPLVEDLTAHKTAALRIGLARSPATALALIVHATVCCAFYRGGERVLKAWMTVRSLERSMQGYESSPAVRALDAERERVSGLLPGQQDDVWDWCLRTDRDTLLDVLAVAAAHGLDAVVTKSDPNKNGQAFGAALADALGLDMAHWYRPTAEGYFGRISKAKILSDLEETRQSPCAPAWAKMKKGELAALAEREVAGTGWLPEPLR
jgi:ParB family chromosome partitioning protein